MPVHPHASLVSCLSGQQCPGGAGQLRAHSLELIQGWVNVGGTVLSAFCSLPPLQVTSSEKHLESLKTTSSLLQALEQLAPAGG